MLKKNTLSVKEAETDSIICIESSCLSFVDDYYYRIHLKEDFNDPNTINFPVTIHALRVDWIIDEQGKALLEAIS